MPVAHGKQRRKLTEVLFTVSYLHQVKNIHKCSCYCSW